MELEQQIIDLINAMPARKERLFELHETCGIDISRLKSRVEELSTTERRAREELEEVRKQISQTVISQGYVESLNLFSEKYKAALEKSFDDRDTLHHTTP
ncbi:MAG TPA: hypothetical protein PLF31_03015 [Candidatus Paceibacterota bacterium]|nr:hypothetical protein [Candidatus Paceibacterota bacterium]